MNNWQRPNWCETSSSRWGVQAGCWEIKNKNWWNVHLEWPPARRPLPQPRSLCASRLLKSVHRLTRALRGEERMCAQGALDVSCSTAESTQQIRQGARRWGAGRLCARACLFSSHRSKCKFVFLWRASVDHEEKEQSHTLWRRFTQNQEVKMMSKTHGGILWAQSQMAELEVCRNLSLEKGKWSVFTVLFRLFCLVISCFSPTWT